MIVVSSVSCIYGLGEPDDFAQMVISLRQGRSGTGTSCCAVWWRTATSGTTWPSSGTGSGCGDTVEIYPAYYKDHAIRVEFFGDEIDRISDFHPSPAR